VENAIKFIGLSLLLSWASDHVHNLAAGIGLKVAAGLAAFAGVLPRRGYRRILATADCRYNHYRNVLGGPVLRSSPLHLEAALITRKNAVTYFSGVSEAERSGPPNQAGGARARHTVEDLNEGDPAKLGRRRFKPQTVPLRWRTAVGWKLPPYWLPGNPLIRSRGTHRLLSRRS
jgi:hypothetical protein